MSISIAFILWPIHGSNNMSWVNVLRYVINGTSAMNKISEHFYGLDMSWKAHTKKMKTMLNANIGTSDKIYKTFNFAYRVLW